MASLSAHLRQAGDHGRLGFHPACPVCCDERLAGGLPADAFVSRRASALVVAGVFAVSSAAPAPALALGGDQDQVGTDSSGVAAPGSGLESDSTDADDPAEGASTSEEADEDAGPVEADLVATGDPDGAPAALPQAAATPPTPAAPAASEAPATSTQAAPPARNGKARTGAAPEAKPPAAAAPAAPETAAPAVTTPATAAPEATSPAADVPVVTAGAPEAASVPRDKNPRSSAPRRATHRVLHRHAKPNAVVVRKAAVPQAQPVVSPAQPRVTTAAYVVAKPSVARAAAVPSHHGGRPARPGDRVHVVFAGESLWSIAGGVLGRHATVAEVAREVDRLWTLNRERIGTGDRNLLPIGTRLVLR